MFWQNLVTGIFGILLVVGFLAIYVAWVKAIPIIVIMVVVLGLAIYDFVLTMREARKGNGG
jgi:Flp pilus assembly protein TadB